jgi:branched-chain amino acid transport system permease protein
MTLALAAEQTLNGLQLGLMLFLIAAGLTLVLGIMDMINLAHGSLYMIGAFIGATLWQFTGSFVFALLLALPATMAIGALLEVTILRRFYARTHLDQVLVTFGLILVFNDVTRMIWGPVPLPLAAPDFLSGFIELGSIKYSAFRFAIIVLGLVVAASLYVLVVHTRLGMWIRAGASDRLTASAMGVNVSLVFTWVFAAGAALCGLAGMMAGPISAVQIGMGEPILILALVVTVIGGVGSVGGAFVGALLIGIADTFGRVLLPPAFGSMAIFFLMAIILAVRPKGLFSVNG